MKMVLLLIFLSLMTFIFANPVPENSIGIEDTTLASNSPTPFEDDPNTFTEKKPQPVLLSYATATDSTGIQQEGSTHDEKQSLIQGCRDREKRYTCGGPEIQHDQSILQVESRSRTMLNCVPGMLFKFIIVVFAIAISI